MYDESEIEGMQHFARAEKQQKFVSDPAEFCRNEGMSLNSNGICADYRNQYLYRIFPFDEALLDPSAGYVVRNYTQYLETVSFPDGLREYLRSQAKSDIVRRIDAIVEALNGHILQGSMTEALALDFYRQLEQLCGSKN